MLTPYEHRPERPVWTCRDCGDQWPCAPARDALTDAWSGDRTGLLIYMATRLLDAIEELGDEATFKRFLGWARGDRSVSEV